MKVGDLVYVNRLKEIGERYNFGIVLVVIGDMATILWYWGKSYVYVPYLVVIENDKKD
tara:strand:- start:947 stop:1120 length:174 start_codon:yes stop_codon:yes gene_type:complete